MLAELSPIRVVSYPERIVRLIPLPYWMIYLIAWELVFLADYLLGFQVEDGHKYSAEFGFLVLFFAMVCITVTYCAKVLSRLFPDLTMFVDHDKGEFREWYHERLFRSYQGYMPIIFGLAFALAESLTAGVVIRQFTPAGTSLYNLRVAYEFVGFFFLGVAVWALINVVRIPIELTKYKIKVTLNQVSGRGLQALGTSFFKMSISIVGVFIPLAIAVLISPLSGNPFILGWLVVGLMMIFGFFILPQLGVHRIMTHEKNQRLLAFTQHLDDAMEKSLKDPSSENMQRLKELFDLQTHLRNMNEWPFNTNTLWQLITALLIPVVLAIMQMFLK
jgi:hypothetical protein